MNPHLRKILYALGLCLLFVSVSSAEEMDPHARLFREHPYPSATMCQTCHPMQFREWSVSPHAYAQLSPVFNAMQAKISKLTNGTNGDFCMRCHTPIGMALKEATFIPNAERELIAREGVTCIVCHRRPEPYGKVSGRIHIEKGNIFAPVYGPTGDKELKRVIHSGEYEINTDPSKQGRDIHRDIIKFPQITTSGFCSSCHDVNHVHGFRLEEAFSEYKSSPAARKHISCQDCHMGKEPGKPSGFTTEPAAIVGGKPTRERPHYNHMFIGPDFSVVHPGIFPHSMAAQKAAALKDWLKFNFTAGWGTDAFEDNVTGKEKFPKKWADATDRYEARDIINDNLALLKEAQKARATLLRNGYHLGNVVVEKAGTKEIRFKVQVQNATEGHNVPTGFDGERPVYLRITVKDKNGKTVFRSGDLDPNGDLRDTHSAYVHSGKLPRDKQLFNLQSKFLIRLAKGGEREEVLPVNYSATPLPFLRPQTNATFLLGHPDVSRKDRKTIPPLGSAWAHYKISEKDLTGSTGPYTADIQLIAGMVPVNLIREIQDVGFDYGLSPKELARRVVKGQTVLWKRTVDLQPGTYAEKP